MKRFSYFLACFCAQKVHQQNLLFSQFIFQWSIITKPARIHLIFSLCTNLIDCARVPTPTIPIYSCALLYLTR